MKKVILATAVVVFFTACHSTTESKIVSEDSIRAFKVDSVKVVKDSIK